MQHKNKIIKIQQKTNKIKKKLNFTFKIQTFINDQPMKIYYDKFRIGWEFDS